MPVPRLGPLLLATGGIYTAQSLIGGFTFMGIPTVLRASGVPLEHIGLVSLAMLVWGVKFLWSPYVERWRMPPDGRRRSRQLILTGQALLALLLAGFAFAGFEPFGVAIVGLVVLAVITATVDIACDAFLIESIASDKRGFANVAQVGGGYLGMIFGNALFVLIFAAAGWLPAVLLLALLLGLMSLPIAFISEPTPVFVPEADARSSLRSALARPEIRIGLAMSVIFEMAGRMIMALSGPFLVDVGVPLSTIGSFNGAGGVAAGLVGVVAGGAMVQRLGAVRSVFLIAALQIVIVALLGLSAVTDDIMLWALIAAFVVESAVMAAGFVVIYARLMGLVSLSQPGVDFTLFQSASAIAAALCGTLAAQLAARFGYASSFGLAVVLACIALPLLWRMNSGLHKGKQT